MGEGDKWRIYLPPDLAYGEEGRMPKVPPHSVIIIETEIHILMEKGRPVVEARADFDRDKVEIVPKGMGRDDDL